MNDTSQWTWPTLIDVLAAKQRIRPYLARTPLHCYSAINDLIGIEVAVPGIERNDAFHAGGTGSNWMG